MEAVTTSDLDLVDIYLHHEAIVQSYNVQEYTIISYSDIVLVREVVPIIELRAIKLYFAIPTSG